MCLHDRAAGQSGERGQGSPNNPSPEIPGSLHWGITGVMNMCKFSVYHWWLHVPVVK